MSVLLTAPTRIAKMLLDASDTVVATYTEDEYDIDVIQRPAWVVFDSGGQFMQNEFSEGVAQWTESFNLELYGNSFGTGLQHESLLKVKNIVVDTVKYFLRNQQLQYEDRRGIEGQRFRALENVMHITLSREPVTLYDAPDKEDKVFGARMSLTVTCRLQIENSFY